MNEYLWLLEVVPPNGPIWRYATEALEVSRTRGAPLTFRAGLDEPTVARGDLTQSFSITDAAMPARRRLPGSRVRLYRWKIGDEYERAELYVEGRVVATDIGGTTEAVTFGVEALHNDLPPMIDTDAVVDARTATNDTSATIFGEVGKRYPTVFGWPGYSGYGTRRPSSDTPWPVVPVPLTAYPTDSDTPYTTAILLGKIIVSEDPRTTSPATVQIRDKQQSVEATENVVAHTDALGRKMVGADYSADQIIFPDSGQGEDVSVDYLAGYNPTGDPAPMRSLYDVLVYVLERWGGDTVDWSRIPEVRDVLGPYCVDTWINDTIEGGVWAWVDMLAATVPIGIRQGPRGGKYLLPLRYRAEQARVVRTVDVSRGQVGRVSGLRTLRTPINKRTARIRDASELVPDGYLTRLTLGSGASESRNTFGLLLTEERVSGLCAASRSRYGERVGDDVEIAWSWDEDTGWRVLDWMAERDALPAETITYRVPESWRLREQDHVRLIDPELEIDDYAIVASEPTTGAEGDTVEFMIPEV